MIDRIDFYQSFGEKLRDESGFLNPPCPLSRGSNPTQIQTIPKD
jgi:hypothetical protein